MVADSAASLVDRAREDRVEELDPLEVASRHPAVKLAVPTVTALVGALGFAAVVWEIRPALDSAGGFIIFVLAATTIAVVVVTYVVSYILAQRSWARHAKSLEERIQQLTEDLGSAKAGRIPADRYQRFEEIQKRDIRLGWIRFHPTLKVDDGSGDKIGAGPAILSTVFNGKVKYVPKESDWSNVLARLDSEEYDMVATPMYDIKERREQVEFTSPIFYADIGLFVLENNRKVWDALGGRSALGFTDAKAFLSTIAKDLELCVHTGELQDKMVSKHFPQTEAVKRINIDEFSVTAALDTMGDPDEGYYSDLYFCERLQGESHKLFQNKKLVNILKPRQILFPVAFALRKGDDTLRKYVNLRLMTIDGERGSGIQRHLVEHTRGIISDSLMVHVDEYFLRKRLPDIEEEDEKEPASKILHFPGSSGPGA